MKTVKMPGLLDGEALEGRRIKVCMNAVRRLAVVVLLSLFELAAQPNPENGYVDSKVCAQCHREIAADYARTGMARSFFYTGTGEYA